MGDTSDSDDPARAIPEREVTSFAELVDLDLVHAHVTEYAEVLEQLRGKLALVLSRAELGRLDSHLRVLPSRGVRAFLAAVVAADAPELARLRGLLDTAPRPLWGPALVLLDAASRAASPRDDVHVPARLAGDVLADLLRGTAHRGREHGAPGVSPELRALLAALHDAAGRHRRGIPAPAAPFRSEPVSPVQSTINAVTEDTTTAEVSASEYARRAGTSRQHATRLARQGKVPARMIGNRWLILTDLEAPTHDSPDPHD
ncbi:MULTISPECIES: helix-turn-helix domain-containing protein [Protofrankia]|nr:MULTISPECIES: helix-turn-helix domain-containing protein [Protofrankia]